MDERIVGEITGCDRCGLDVFHWGALECVKALRRARAQDAERIRQYDACLKQAHRDIDSERERRTAAQESVVNHWEPKVRALERVVADRDERVATERRDLIARVAALEREQEARFEENARLRDVLSVAHVIGCECHIEHDDPGCMAMRREVDPPQAQPSEREEAR